MKGDEMARLAFIVSAAVFFIYLVTQYNDSSSNNVESFYAEGDNVNSDPVENQANNVGNNAGNNAGNNVGNNVGNNMEETGNDTESDESDPLPSEGENNETFKTVQQNNNANNNESNNANRLPSECYPKDVLTPDDLLPQDSNSTWAQTVPAGQGALGDQNFLNAGFHVGINTVGQSLRNANLQLRSEPANPQVKVSPWLQTTIEPDANRRALEIGA